MAQQFPDNVWELAGTAFGAIGTVAASIAGAYALVRKTRSETNKEAATVAQTTVQATLDAMKTVIDGLTRELTRRQEELDEARAEVHELREENRVLASQNAEQERRIEQLESIALTLKARVEQLERRELGRGTP